MSDEIVCAWRGRITDAEIVELGRAQAVAVAPGWWDRVRPHSLGWVVARAGRTVVGFVNVAWDGGAHAFLLDIKTHAAHQHQGIGQALVHHAADNARGAGCHWLHVDFEPQLCAFYFEACGFRPTDAGLIELVPPAGPQKPEGPLGVPSPVGPS